MRYFHFAVYFMMSILVLIEAKLTKDDVEKQFLHAMKKCNGSEHLSEDKSRWLLNARIEKESVSVSEICLLSCTLEKMGMIDKDLQLQQKPIMKFVREIQKHPGTSENLVQELLSCARNPDIHEESSCIGGYKTYDCLREILHKYWNNKLFKK